MECILGRKQICSSTAAVVTILTAIAFSEVITAIEAIAKAEAEVLSDLTALLATLMPKPTPLLGFLVVLISSITPTACILAWTSPSLTKTILNERVMPMRRNRLRCDAQKVEVLISLLHKDVPAHWTEEA
jgi:hypothetical protein